MSDCKHPFKSVSEEYALIKLTNGSLERSEVSNSEADTNVRVAVQYCGDCKEVIQAESFESGIPISHINDICTSDESDDCLHGYDFIKTDTLTYQLEDAVVTTQANITVTICDECNMIVDVEDDVDRLPLETI